MRNKWAILCCLFAAPLLAQSPVNGQGSPVTGAGGGSAGNPSSAGFIDPTQAPYNVKADAKTGADGTTTNTQNTFSSANQNCASADTGKLAIVVNSASGAYPFGTGLVTVTGCNGNSWTLSTTANASIAGTANWAIGTGNGASLSSAYTAAYTARKNLALPCGVMVVEAPPFIGTIAATDWLSQRPDIQGCNTTGLSVFILHPNITAGTVLQNTIFAFYSAQGPTAGTFGLAGLFVNSKIENLSIMGLEGNIPVGNCGSSTCVLISGFNHVHNVQMQGISFVSGNHIAISLPAESEASGLNLQNFNQLSGASGTVTGVQASGSQGEQVISNSVFAFGLNPAIACNATGVTCSVHDNYMTGVTTGVTTTAATKVSVINNNINAGNAGAGGAITDGGNASTFYVFGNPNLQTQCASCPAITLTNASSVMDISGTNINTTSAGFNISGAGTVNDRAGNTFSSALTQFTGKYVPVAGGAMATQQISASTNFGTNLTAQTLISNVVAKSVLNIRIGARQVTAGVGCGAGSNTALATLAWTAPGGTAETQASTTLSISANGAVDSGATAEQTFTIPVNVNTTVTYTSTSVLVSAGCSTVPQYVIEAAVL